MCRVRNPSVLRLRFGLLRFRSPLLTEYLRGLFSFGYLDVSVPRVPFPRHRRGILDHYWKSGFSHSETAGYNDCNMSYRRFRDVAHVLHQLLVPGHPPFALISPIPVFCYKIQNKKTFRLIFLIYLLKGKPSKAAFLRVVASLSLSTTPKKTFNFCGPDRIRTGDLSRARRTL